MEPGWLAVVGWIALGIAFASALLVLADEILLGHRQHMRVMNLVHPITALYWGPVWLRVYFRHARKSSQKVMKAEAERLAREDVEPDEIERRGESTEPLDLQRWYIGNAVSHCGAGCTLGDIGGEWILFAVFASPKLGAAGTFGWEVIVDLAFAWTLGIAFQYFAIVPMREEGGRLQGIWKAVKVDTLSILSFQLGLFGWMALSHFVIWQPPLEVDTSGHWFMMQIGMIVGYFTAWPVNGRLVRKGIKEKMDYRKHLARLIERLRDDRAVADTRLSRARRAQRAPI